MSIVGEKFKNNEVFVPEVLIAARAMNTGTEVLKPYLAEAGVENKGTAVIGTVKGDLHDIGKNLVKMMLEGKALRLLIWELMSLLIRLYSRPLKTMRKSFAARHF